MSKGMAVALALVLGASVQNSGAATGLSVFHIGNSLTDETYGVHRIAEGFGHTWAAQIYGRSMIPGAPIRLLWTENVSKTADKNSGYSGFFLEASRLGDYNEQWIEQSYPTLWSASLYLGAKSYDAVVLQVFAENGDSYQNQETVDGCLGFAGDAYRGNPDCQVYIYTSHTMKVGRKCDTTEYTRIHEPLARAISARYPTRKPACVIPIISVWNQMMDAGYTDLWASATDGHASVNGKYILITTFYATIYRKNPEGAIASNFFVSGSGSSVSPSFAAKAQEIAWSVVQGYPMSGVGSTPVTERRTTSTGASVSRQGVSVSRMFDLTGRRVADTKAGAVANLTSAVADGHGTVIVR